MKFTINHNGQDVNMSVKKFNITTGEYGNHEAYAEVVETTVLKDHHVSKINIYGEQKEKIVKFIEEVIKEEVEKKINSQKKQEQIRKKRSERFSVQLEIEEIQRQIESEQTKRKDEYKSEEEFKESLGREKELQQELEVKNEQYEKLTNELEAM